MAERIRLVNKQLLVPDNPVVPYIEGDGIGHDIWENAQLVLDKAVEIAYKSSRKIFWKEILAGEKSLSFDRRMVARRDFNDNPASFSCD